MSVELAAVIDRLWSLGPPAFLVFLRVGAAMALLPAFGERMLPMRVRLALTIAFTLVVYPSAETLLPDPAQLQGRWVILAGAEIAAGLVLGILFRLLVVGLQIAGGIAANVTSLSQIFGGTVSDPQPAIATLFVLAGLALATASGLHVKVALMLTASYELFPPGRLPAPGDLALWGAHQVSWVFALAFSLAVPFVIGAMVYNLALGAINRAMPQLMVAFVGAPLITGAGLVLLFFTAPLALAVWNTALDAALAAPMELR